MKYQKVRGNVLSRLTQHHTYLTPVISGLVDQVVHLAPQRVLPRLAVEIDILHGRKEAIGCQHLNKGSLFNLNL